MLPNPILRLAFAFAAVAAVPTTVLAQSNAPAQMDASPASLAVTRGISSSIETSFAGAVEPLALARDLQGQLKRLGCLGGEVDGVWGEGSKKALKDFARHAKLSIASDEPTPAVLDVATAMQERACPLVCDDDQRAVNGRCVAKERKPVRREAEAASERRRHRAERPSRAESSGGESARSSGGGGSGGGLKLCHVGGRGMAICD